MLDIGLPSLRIGGMTFFVSEIFLDPRSALISKQSKQSGPLSLVLPSYPRPIPNPLSPVFTFMRVSRFYLQIANGDGAILTSPFSFSTSFLHLPCSERRASEIFMLFLSSAPFARRTKSRSILLLETGILAKHILETLIT